jgi:RNA polymerase sigma-70 factor (ECF subfamily)
MDSDRKADVNLAARVAQGDAGAFDEFYDRHADMVFAFIFHSLNGARADAEEIWQDTFVAAVRALPGYRGESRLTSWLCGIARRKVADFLRRRGGVAGLATTVPPERLLELMDSGPLPDAVLRESAVRARIMGALAELPAVYRDALVGRYVDGRTVDELAQRLGRSYKATESLLSRGRAALRELLSGSNKEYHE